MLRRGDRSGALSCSTWVRQRSERTQSRKPARPSRRIIGACAAVLIVAVLPGCSGSSSGAPDFRPVPSGNDAGGGTAGVAPPKKQPAIQVVAEHLVAPDAIAMLPDGTALVGERTTGRIVRVQPRAGRPVPTVRVLRGLSTIGGGGLLGLAVSPDYDQDNLIYAYVSTKRDNRVVDFTLHGPVTPVLTGIPRGRTGNSGRIAFGPDGELYVATGDAGRPRLAADPASLAGKMLRVDDIGRPAVGNPRSSSPVFATGQRSVTGLCSTKNGMLAVQSGPQASPQVDAVTKGANFGFPHRNAASVPALATLPAKADDAGGCALLDARLWVASLGGQALFSAAPLAKRSKTHGLFGAFTTVLDHRFGRLDALVAARDGALWMTTSNRDGHGHPVPTDERVIRYLPTNGNSGAAAT